MNGSMLSQLLDPIKNADTKPLTRYFDRLIREFYDAGDRRAGKVLGQDREGNEKWFPFVSLSMVIVDIYPEEALDLTATFQSLVELKRYAKSIPGSKIVRDRMKHA